MTGETKDCLKDLEASHRIVITLSFGLDALAVYAGQKNKEFQSGRVDNLPRLDEYLVETAEVKLSSRVSNVSEIFISSSPIRSDSP